MLHDRLSILQKQMLLRLEEIRIVHKHKGTKGNNVEQIVREFLREFLPPYNRIGHGEIVDTRGNTSTQLDIIITNEFHPYLNDLSQPSIFLIEGIACVGEVKSLLTSNDLDTALQSCKIYKSLQAIIPSGAFVVNNDEDVERFVNKRPYFLFAFESQISIQKIKEKIESFSSQNNLPLNMQIDSVFLLDRGLIVNFGTGAGVLKFVTPEGNSLPGFIIKDIAQDDRILLSFLSWLSACMPKLQLPNSPILYYVAKEEPKSDRQTGNQ